MRVFIPVAFMATILLSACNNTPTKPTPVEALTAGTHPLRKMLSQTETSGRIGGNFIVFSGSVGAKTMVTFAWLANDGSYIISSLPLEKIRVRFDPKVSTPSIKFEGIAEGKNSGFYADGSDVQGFLSIYADYATLTIREEDWPEDINLPLSPKQTDPK